MAPRWTRNLVALVATMSVLYAAPAAYAADSGSKDDSAEPDAPSRSPRLMKVGASVSGTTDEEVSIAAGVTELLIALLSGKGSYELVGSDVLREALDLGAGGALACARDEICLGNAAATLGIRKLFAGKVGSSPDTGITMTLSLVDVATFKVDRATIIEAKDMEDLFGKLPEAVDLLLRARRPANLHVDVNVPKAIVTLDGVLVASGPRATFKDIEPGEHRVRIEREGYGPVTRALTISEGEDKELDVKLLKAGISKRGSVFNRWWFWTGAGVIVAGGVTAVVVLYTVADRIPADVPVFPLN